MPKMIIEINIFKLHIYSALTLAGQNAVNEATSRLKHKDIFGKVCLGRQGLGVGEAGLNKRWDTADCKEKRKMITDEL